jgi:hypothetical protein
MKEAYMRFIKKQLLLWTMVLIFGVAAIAIPSAARVSPTAIAVARERQDHLAQLTSNANEDADAKHSKAKHSKDKAAAGLGVARQDDDYYDKRREYWEKRVERRLDRREEYLNEQTGDDDDAKDSKAGKDKKDSKADKDDADDEDDSVDQEHDELERRREYWRKRLEKDW